MNHSSTAGLRHCIPNIQTKQSSSNSSVLWELTESKVCEPEKRKEGRMARRCDLLSFFRQACNGEPIQHPANDGLEKIIV